MPLLGIIAVVVAGIIVLLLIIIATRPAVFRLERSTEIKAAPETIFPLINDFRQWSRWSPWEKLDPGMRRTFSGAPAGVGAGYAWAGNKKAGEGRMTITESKPGQLVSIKLEFIKPFPATNQAIFTLTPAGTGTRVVWAMEGRRNFMMKGFSLMFDMEKLVGSDFERGLANLKEAVAR